MQKKKKKYQRLDKVCELDKKEDERIDKKITINNYNRSDLNYKQSLVFINIIILKKLWIH